MEALRAAIDHDHYNGQTIGKHMHISSAIKSVQAQRPRWVRINTVQTSLGQQLNTTFVGFTRVDSLEGLSATTPTILIDAHVPNLIAVCPRWQVSNLPEYRKGSLILQDKASCFPALLLDPRSDSVCLDACAAPGNKTTHLAALMSAHGHSRGAVRVWACERDTSRAKILDRMIQLAGANGLVNVKTGQDFLGIDPSNCPWNDVTHLLLDPSCSGSGIVGRDEELHVDLPSIVPAETNGRPAKGQKKSKTKSSISSLSKEVALINNREERKDLLKARLSSLSSFQLRLLVHAFNFPKAERITYSTCSNYAEENEHVVIKALLAPIAKERGWRILRRDEQPEGLKAWHIRGNATACYLHNEDGPSFDTKGVAEGCIRCDKGTMEGTQGFFVAGFVRENGRSDGSLRKLQKNVDNDDEEWNGFDDDI